MIDDYIRDKCDDNRALDSSARFGLVNNRVKNFRNNQAAYSIFQKQNNIGDDYF